MTTKIEKQLRSAVLSANRGGLSQMEIAKRGKVSQPAVSKVIHGRPVMLDTAYRIAKGVGLEIRLVEQ